MSDIKENLKDTRIWLRGLYMLLFVVFFAVARLVLMVVVVLQFLVRLISGELNERLLDFGGSLAAYLYQVTRFLTFNQEQRPFPFADWPAPEPRAADETETGATQTTAEPAQADQGDATEGTADEPAPEPSAESPAAEGKEDDTPSETKS
jgi:hypothetical protein